MPNGTHIDAGEDVLSAAGIRNTWFWSGIGLGGTPMCRLLEGCSGRGQALTQRDECESFGGN